jgi:3-dehydroquinate synthase
VKVHVPVDGRAYDVHVGDGMLARVPQLSATPAGARVAVIGDRRLNPVLKRVAQAFERRGHPVVAIPLRADESLKSLHAVEPLYGRLLRAGLDRRATIVGVGGGTIGDSIGFLAATYLRGVRFVSVPTTLLADVDSSIGGKTGLNHALGKNLIGAFSQPDVVVVDTALLRSLDRRDRISGLGEIVKYGLIADTALYRTVERSWKDVVALREPLTTKIVARCIGIKAVVVAADERERTGIREQLNFGHTVAHALEQASGYGRFRHGEAVIAGMRAAVALSRSRGHLQEPAAERIQRFLTSLPVPPVHGFTAAAIAAATRHDKKRGAKGIRFVLLETVGRTVRDEGVSRAELVRALREVGFS